MAAVPRALRPVRTVAHGVGDLLEDIGKQLRFYAGILYEIVTSIILRLKYRNVVFGLVSDITIGAEALIVGGGMIFVIFSMSFFTGTEVGLQGFKGLQQIGAENFTGLIGAFANTREVTPLIAGVAFAAQVGAGFTAELGRDAHLRGDRRPRGHVGAVEGLPGRHPRGRGPHRHHPAVPHLALRELLRHQARRRRTSSACRPAPTTTTSGSTCPWRTWPTASAKALPLRHGGRDDPLLLRLLRHRWPGRCRAWPWAGPSGSRS